MALIGGQIMIGLGEIVSLAMRKITEYSDLLNDVQGLNFLLANVKHQSWAMPWL